MKAYRARRKRGELRLTITRHRDDVAAIARAGYAEAATTDRGLQADAVGLFVSDAVAQISGRRRLRGVLADDPAAVHDHDFEPPARKELLGIFPRH